MDDDESMARQSFHEALARHEAACAALVEAHDDDDTIPPSREALPPPGPHE